MGRVFLENSGNDTISLCELYQTFAWRKVRHELFAFCNNRRRQYIGTTIERERIDTDVAAFAFEFYKLRV